jgi:hypothetical protein
VGNLFRRGGNRRSRLARSEALASALPPGLFMLIVIIAAARFRAR